MKKIALGLVMASLAACGTSNSSSVQSTETSAASTTVSLAQVQANEGQVFHPDK